jgi:hypothetical protein
VSQLESASQQVEAVRQENALLRQHILEYEAAVSSRVGWGGVGGGGRGQHLGGKHECVMCWVLGVEHKYQH